MPPHARDIGYLKSTHLHQTNLIKGLLPTAAASPHRRGHPPPSPIHISWRRGPCCPHFQRLAHWSLLRGPAAHTSNVWLIVPFYGGPAAHTSNVWHIGPFHVMLIGLFHVLTTAC